MAIMMARLYSGNYDLLALRNAYHGMSSATMGLVAHSTWKYNVPQVSVCRRCTARDHGEAPLYPASIINFTTGSFGCPNECHQSVSAGSTTPFCGFPISSDRLF